jgi:hypothetical protein
MNLHGVSLDSEQRRVFGEAPLIGSHSLHELELFSDDGLAALLDRHPREHVYALTMGTDPLRWDENRLALHDGLSGRQLLDAVKRGRLWLNIKRVDEHEPEYARIVRELYGQLATQVPGFVVEQVKTTLLISSPQALVYYHVDGAPSLLWHLRGEKRVWMYPALDERFISRELLEDIHAGVAHEYVPYEPHFDNHAQVKVLKPGQFASWPQNAPHRVTNLDSFNVSLSTEHYTPASRRRARVYTANRFLRTHLRLSDLSTTDHGLRAFAKSVVHRAAGMVGLDKRQTKRHAPTMRVDPTAPLCVRPLLETKQPTDKRQRKRASAAATATRRST